MVTASNSRVLKTIRFMLIMMLFCPLGHGKVIYVDENAAGANDGSSWENAYIYLQEALADANSSEQPVEIRVAQGVYKPDGGIVAMPEFDWRTLTFQLISDVSLKGGYAGAVDPNARDIELYETILSGDLYGDDVEVADPCALLDEPTRTDNSYHVVTSNGTDSNTILDGFTVTGGNANGAEPYNYGGGLYNLQSDLTLVNCNFHRNAAISSGGAIYNSRGLPLLDSCTFKYNHASGGGAIAYRGINSKLVNCIFRNNSSLYWGGALESYGQSLELIDCIFIDNSAGQSGGSFNNSGNGTTLVGCKFIGNESGGGGGAIVNQACDTNLTNCIFIANSAKSRGGAIYSRVKTELNLTNCTFHCNSSDVVGGSFCNSYSNTTIRNCIMWDNSAPNGTEISLISPDYPSNASITYSNIKNGESAIHIEDGCTFVWSEGNINENPLFANPGYWVDINDPNIVVEPNYPNAIWIDGDYHLKSQAGRWDPNQNQWVTDANTSPCIDAGDTNSDWTTELWPHGKRINIGAYGGTTQASMSLLAEGDPADCNNDWVVDAEDLLILCEDWLTEKLPTTADINRDGAVKFDDYSLLAAKWLHDIFVYVNLVDVPNVVGMTQTDAEAAITTAGLIVGTVNTVNNNTVSSGDVISQDPAAGTNIISGSTVDIIVSLGPVVLECEAEGYPCSLSEVPIEILERSIALGEEVHAMFEHGDSTAEIKAWLNEQVDMAEVQADETAVRFRLNGGRGTWILREEAFATRSAPGAASSAHRPVLQSVADRPVPQSAIVPFHVVGEDIKPKKALVLSPMQWDFEDNTDGETVTAILRGTRGYEDVTYLSNESMMDTVVNIDTFKGWYNYQVIHFDSHGALLCDEGPCRAVIVVLAFETIFEKSEDQVITAEDFATIEEKGVVFVSDEREDGEMSWDLGLEADFFRNQYPNGLDNTLIFFNSCASYSNDDTDLANALRGSTSVFIGWNDAADIDGAIATSKKLYQELSEWGYTVETAYNNLGDLKTDSYGHTLIQSGRKAGGDLRIRDIVYLLNPETGQILSPSDLVAIVGKQGDGEPDAVPYLVQVDGVKTVHPGVQVHVSVGMIQAEPQPLSNGEVNDHDQWLVSGVVNLPFDLEKDELVNFEAWVDLPSGGESNHEVMVTLTGEEQVSLLGEWIVDNDSLGVKALGFELKHVKGEIRATFRKKGKVDVVYDNWEYCVFDRDTDLSIGGINCMNYEEFTTTINAKGTTTYEVDGDTINFGHYFESDFLEGTQMVQHIKDWTPDVLPDVYRMMEEPLTGRDVFAWSPNYELGSTLRFVFWNHEFILYRRWSADK